MSRLDPNVLNEILDRCLIKLQAGQDIEAVLNEYPAYRDSLRPILEAMQAVWASKGSDTVPVAAMTRSRAKLMKAVYDLKQAPPLPWWQQQFVFMRHAMLPVVTALTCFGLLFTGIASAQSLPGQALYPVKLAAEHLALSLPASPARQLAREENYDQRRKGEVESLIDNKDHQEITLSGLLTQGAAGIWRLDSLDIVIAENLLEKAAALTGQYVEVQADLSSDGQMNVEAIEPHFYMVVGRIQNLEHDRAQVGDIWVEIGADTEVSGLLESGSLVEVSVTRTTNNDYLAVKIVPAGIAKMDASSGAQKQKSTQTLESKTTESEGKSESTLELPKTSTTEPWQDAETHEATATRSVTPSAQPTSTLRPENPENPTQASEVENQPADPAPAATTTPHKEQESRPTRTPTRSPTRTPTRTPTQSSDHKDGEHSSVTPSPSDSSD